MITALVLLGLIVIFNILGPGGFFYLALAVVGTALFELLDVLSHTGHRVSVPFALACGIGMMFIAYHFPESPELLVGIIAITAYGSFLLSMRPGRGPTAAGDAGWMLLAVVWIGGGGAGAVSILTLSEDGALLLTAYILITALDDIGAYFVGTRFGKHKMAPSISPAKSWEGFAGGAPRRAPRGVLFGVLLLDLSIAEGLGLAAISSLFARWGTWPSPLSSGSRGVKDSGRLLPGHGGFLDRPDAIVFCAPAAFSTSSWWSSREVRPTWVLEPGHVLYLDARLLALPISSLVDSRERRRLTAMRTSRPPR